MSFRGSVHRIAGSSGTEVGGLIKKKKNPTSQEAGGGGERRGVEEAGEKSSKPSEFKVPAPRTSIFGLDVLAKRKREEREAREEKVGEKRMKMTQGSGITSSSRSESHFSEDGARVSFGKSSEKQRERVYRGSHVETPSHTGGVSEEALDRIQQRLRRERPFAVGAKSRDSDRGHKYACTLEKERGECIARSNT